jgi:hypothetical protein
VTCEEEFVNPLDSQVGKSSELYTPSFANDMPWLFRFIGKGWLRQSGRVSGDDQMIRGMKKNLE